MSARHRRPQPRRIDRRKLAGAGVAGVAAVFATGPLAHATPSTGPSATGTATHPPTGTDEHSKASTQANVAPDYGFQKVRVGVQVKSGAWVPPGTTTAGTKITITETGAANPGVTTCTTDASTQVAGSTATYCTTFTQQALVERLQAAGMQPDLTVRPSPPGVPSDEFYTVFSGDTVTITQSSVNANLVTDPTTGTVPPCETTSPPFCDPAETDYIFDDNGLPPTAAPNSATVLTGHSVTVKVLANDQTHGAPATLDSVSKPAHGTAVISGGTTTVSAAAVAGQQAASTAQQIVYTPAAGFVGTDSFRYTMSTPNGRSTATLTIRVLAPPPTAHDDTATTTSGTAVSVNVLANDDAHGGGALSIKSVGDPAHGTAKIDGTRVVYTPAAGFTGTDSFTYTATTAYGTATATVTVTVTSPPLANTGGPDADLAELGALLLLTGGAASVAGRRRRRAEHADPA